MKKLKYLSLLLIIILSVGCGSKDGEKVLKEALDNMSNVKSGSIVANMSALIDGYSIDMVTTTDFLENGNAYSQTSVQALGTELTEERYTVFDEDKVYVYYSEDAETWFYEEYEISEYEDQNMSVTGIGSLAQNYKSVSEVKSDKEGHKKLEVVIDKDVMMSNLATSQELGSDANFELNEDFTIYVYVKNGYITGLSIDFTDVLNESNEDSQSTYTIEFDIINHNTLTDIKMSNDIKENAVLVEASESVSENGLIEEE